MFSTREYLIKKSGHYGPDRLSYLQSLVSEYQNSVSIECKLQVLANLANFAYDPLNFGYLRTLQVIDLFLDGLSEPHDKIIEFSVGGLCNICLDKESKEYILKNDGINLIIQYCLPSANEETVVSAITSLMFLATPQSKKVICTEPIVDAMITFTESKNSRLANLGTIFLDDYCSTAIVKSVRAKRLAATQ